MVNRPTKITIIAILGFIIGLFYISVFRGKVDIDLLINGLVCIIFSLGLFKIKNWARIMGIISSWISIFIYLNLIIYTITYYQRHHGFAVIALILYLPLLLFSIWVLDCLNQPKIKQFFKENKD
jgi:hypothetical protein